MSLVCDVAKAKPTTSLDASLFSTELDFSHVTSIRKDELVPHQTSSYSVNPQEVCPFRARACWVILRSLRNY